MLTYLYTVQLIGNVALARSFTLSRLIHLIEQRVWRVASQANTQPDTQPDTLERVSFGIHLLVLASTYLSSLNWETEPLKSSGKLTPAQLDTLVHKLRIENTIEK